MSRNLPDELAAAHASGDYHAYLAAKIDQLVGLHEMGKAADQKYIGRETVAHIEMLKACDLALWQLKEVCGYPIPYEVDRRYPKKMAGSAGNNPFKCGMCEARKLYPDLHLKHDAERHGGMYVKPDDFIKT